MFKNKYDFLSLEFQSSFWNMISSILNAGQSAVMILIVTRLLGPSEAGIVSIGYATGYLLSKIGEYGIRNFQVTDTNEKYKFTDYLLIRLITTIVMFIIILFYCKMKDYSFEKYNVVFAICILKLSEVIEDVIHGRLQQKGRLDIAGKMLTIRLVVNYVLFLGIIIFTKNIIIASWAVAIVSLIVVFVSTYFNRNKLLYIKNKIPSTWKNSFTLLKVCFPLFFTSFFDIYITNVPKYAIDRCLTEEFQGYFGIIFMPIFTINLFSCIIYRPVLTKMASLREIKEYKKLGYIVVKQIIIILLISIIFILGGYSIGLDILQLVYGISLNDYLHSFVILLIGGGMAAIYNFLLVCIIIIRKQKSLLFLSSAVVIIATLLADHYVNSKGILGASELYLLLMSIQMIVSAGIFMKYFRKFLLTNCDNKLN